MHKMYYGTSEVARILGVSKQTLLRYESKRIFPRARRNPVNKRREYSPADIERLKHIVGRA